MFVITYSIALENEYILSWSLSLQWRDKLRRQYNTARGKCIKKNKTMWQTVTKSYFRLEGEEDPI